MTINNYDDDNDFITAINALIQIGDATPKNVRLLSERYEAINKRKKKQERENKRKGENKNPIGRPKSEDSANKKLAAITLWVLLSQEKSIPKMQRRLFIAKGLNKSDSFVDKALAGFEKSLKRGYEACFIQETRTVILGTPAEIQKFMFRLESLSDYFNKGFKHLHIELSYSKSPPK